MTEKPDIDKRCDHSTYVYEINLEHTKRSDDRTSSKWCGLLESAFFGGIFGVVEAMADFEV